MHFDWGTFFISVPAILLIVGGFAKLYANSYIDTIFKKKLEEHKTDLQLMIENNKFDLQRKMADFNLYTNKKHESYMCIYDMFLNADGSIRGLMGLKRSPDYSEFGLADIEKRLRSYNLLENVIEGYLEKWRNYTGNQRPVLYKEINDYLAMVEIQKAGIKLSEAKNYFLIKRLYLSEQVQDILYALNSSLSSYLTGVEFLLQHHEPFRESTNLDAQIQNELNSLGQQMKQELQVGYYNNHLNPQ